MNLPKKTEIEWRKAKLLAGGANGLSYEYAALYAINGMKPLKNHKLEFSLPPHDDMVRIFKELAPHVAAIEQMDYAREIIGIEGYSPTESQIKLTQQVVEGKIRSIEITGISISKKKNKRMVVISYKKPDKNDNLQGHATNQIPIDSEEFIYDCQDDIKEIINNIENELYKYEFEEKFGDMEQLTIPEPDEEDE